MSDAQTKLNHAVIKTQSTLTSLAVLLETIRYEASLAKEDQAYVNSFGDHIPNIAETFQSTLEASLDLKLLQLASKNAEDLTPSLEEQTECLNTYKESCQAKFLNECLAEHRQSLSQMDPGTKYNKHKVDGPYAKFWTLISSIATPGAKINATVSDLAEFYGDVLASNTETSINCPLTKEVLVDPCTAGCRHCFSRTALMEFLTVSGYTRTMCPVQNCSGYLDISSIRPCPEMEALVTKLQALEKQHDEEKAKEEELAALLDDTKAELAELGLPLPNKAGG